MKRVPTSKTKLNGQKKPARKRTARVKEETTTAPRQRRLIDEIIEGDALQELTLERCLRPAYTGENAID